jgi:7-carboxy-7-deazaguanine synthase
MIKVCEHFYTIQGEGPNLGIPSYLIRFSNCNLCCDYCDTKYWGDDDGEELTPNLIDNIMSMIPNNCQNIIITGGEPSLYFKDQIFLVLLSKISEDPSRHIDIETNGLPDINLLKTSNIYKTIFSFEKTFITTYNKITFNISPKFHLECYPIRDLIMDNIYKYYELIRWDISICTLVNYKIVYDYTQRDFIKEFIINHINKSYKNNLYIMPMTPMSLPYPNLFESEYKTSCEDTIEFCKKYGLRYTPRIHIDVYGLRRGV